MDKKENEHYILDPFSNKSNMVSEEDLTNIKDIKMEDIDNGGLNFLGNQIENPSSKEDNLDILNFNIEDNESINNKDKERVLKSGIIKRKTENGIEFEIGEYKDKYKAIKIGLILLLELLAIASLNFVIVILMSVICGALIAQTLNKRKQLRLILSNKELEVIGKNIKMKMLMKDIEKIGLAKGKTISKEKKLSWMHMSKFLQDEEFNKNYEIENEMKNSTYDYKIIASVESKDIVLVKNLNKVQANELYKNLVDGD